MPSHYCDEQSRVEHVDQTKAAPPFAPHVLTEPLTQVLSEDEFQSQIALLCEALKDPVEEGRRVRSFILAVPPGAYAAVPAVRSDQWVQLVRSWLASPEGRAVLQRRRIGFETFLKVAVADAKSADWSTGRNVATAHETAARRAGVSVDTVKKVRRELSSNGLMVTVVEGRHLTSQERVNAIAIHGRRQVACASVRALTAPREFVMSRSTPLPRSGSCSSTSRSRVVANAHPRARRRMPNRPTERPVAAWQVAQRLIDRMPWLDAGHRGRLVDAVAPYVANGWTAEDIVRAIDLEHATAGRTSIRPDLQSRPVGLFIHQMRRACRGVAPTVASRTRLERQRARHLDWLKQDALNRADAVPPPPSFFNARKHLRREGRFELRDGRQSADHARAIRSGAACEPCATVPCGSRCDSDVGT